MPEEKRTLRGRPRYSDQNRELAIKFSTSLPPDLYKRLEAFCEAEEREKSFAIRKALEPWLAERGF